MPRLDGAGMHRSHRDLVHALARDRNERVVVGLLLEALARIEILAQWKRVPGPGAVPQPLARIPALVRADAEEVGAGALHAVRGGVDVGDAGIARIVARERHADPEQPGGQGKPEVQRVARAAPGLVAAPERDQAGPARARLSAELAQRGCGDRSAECGHGPVERLDLDGKLFELHGYPMSAAAWRYHPTR